LLAIQYVSMSLQFYGPGFQHAYVAKNAATTQRAAWSRSAANIRGSSSSKKSFGLTRMTATSSARVQSDPAGVEQKNGAWLPIGSVSSLVGDVPTSVEVVGIRLAVWRNGTSWSVMRDACPHRLAPLSQGRVDPTTGCIECPYHGWQFSTTGACTRIPQADSRRPAGSGSAADPTSATSFPVRVTGDVLWAFLPLPPGQVLT
jgi:phenylpropionate dioxygenase-like ring-hydroxylating dioxygenase large terminal subunit